MNAGPTDSNALTDAQKGELYKWLSESAWQRVDRRRNVEWKVYFGVWTGHGALAAFLFSMDATLTYGQFGLIAAASLTVCLAFILLWLPWLQSAHRLDQRTGYWWSSKIEELCGTSIPETYFPPLIAKKKWLRADTPIDERENGKWETKQLHATIFGSLVHRGASTVIAITIAFYVLAMTAAAGRIGTPKESNASVKIEKLEVSDGAQVQISANEPSLLRHLAPAPTTLIPSHGAAKDSPADAAASTPGLPPPDVSKTATPDNAPPGSK